MSHRILKTSDWFHQDGFPVAVERRNPQEPFPMHAHEFSELVIITGGSGLHVTGGRAYPLAAGDVFVISGGRPHTYAEMHRLCLVNLLFQPEKLPWHWADLPALAGYHAMFTLEPAWRRRHEFKSRLHLRPEELHHVLGLVDTLEAELHQRAPGFRFIASAAFMQIVGFLSRCYSRSWNPDARALLRIAETITHLETHYTEPVDLDALAGMARMSKRSFLRAFRAATGSTPIAYLLQLRLNHAAHLLRHSSRNITEVAFATGFNDSNYFTRQFRRRFGASPRQWRMATPALSLPA